MEKQIEIKIDPELAKHFTELKTEFTNLNNDLIEGRISNARYKSSFKAMENKVVETIIKKIHPKVMKDNDDTYVYYDGYYHNDKDTAIRSISGFVFGFSTTDSLFRTILHKIKSFCSINRKDFDEIGDFVNLNNGVYDITNKKLLPHSNKYNFLYKIDTNFDKNITFEIVRKYFEEATTSEEDLLTLQEFFGFCLFPSYKLQDLDKFMLLWGTTGHNRKTKICNLLRQLLGDLNISSIDLDALTSDKHATAQLYGKKANIGDDIPKTTINDTSSIKKLVGGGQITARNLYKDAFQYTNKAKLIYSCNTLPEINDTSEAWWSKVIMLEFMRNFKNNMNTINGKVLTEGELIDLLKEPENMQAVLNFAIEGLHRLIANKKFSYNHDETKARWVLGSNCTNVITNFWNTCIVSDSKEYISKRELYEFYLSYVETQNNTKKLGIKTFGKYVRSLGIKEGRASNVVKGKAQSEIWKNIKLNENYIKAVVDGKVSLNEKTATDKKIEDD